MEFSIRNLFSKDKNGSPLNPASGENGSAVPSNGAQLSSLDLNQVAQGDTSDSYSPPALLPTEESQSQQPPPLTEATPFIADQQSPQSPFAAAAQPPQTEAPQSPFAAAAQPPQTEAPQSPFAAAAQPPQTEAPASPFAGAAQPPQTEAPASPFAAAAQPPQTEAPASPFAAAAQPPQTEAPASPFAAAAQPPQTEAPLSPFAAVEQPHQPESAVPPLEPAEDSQPQPNEVPSPFAAAPTQPTFPPLESPPEQVPTSPFASAQESQPPLSPFIAPDAPAESPPSPTVADSPFASASPFSSSTPPTAQDLPPGVPAFDPSANDTPTPSSTPPTQADEISPSPFGSVTAVIDELPSNTPQPAATQDASPPLDQPGEQDSRVELPLQELLQSYSVEQLGFDPSKVPTHVTTSLPLAVIKPQLSSGKIALPLSAVAEGCEERFHRAFAQADQSLEIRVPIQQVFRYLPTGCMAPNTGLQPEPVAAETPFAASTEANPFAPAQDATPQFETPFSTKADEDEKSGLSAPAVQPAEPPVPPFEVASVPNLLATSETPAEDATSPFAQPQPAEPEIQASATEIELPLGSSPFGAPVAKPEEPAESLEEPPPAPTTPSAETPPPVTPDQIPPPLQELDLSSLDPAPEPAAVQAVVPEPPSSLPDLPEIPAATVDMATGETATPEEAPANPWATSPPEASENPWGADQSPSATSEPLHSSPSPLFPVDDGESAESHEPLAPEAILPDEPTEVTPPTPQPTSFVPLKPLTPLPQACSDFGLKVPKGGISNVSSQDDELTSDDLLENLEDLPPHGSEFATEEPEQEVEEDFTFGFQDDDPTLMTLRAVFETDEQINLEKAVELSGHLPGISAAVFLDGNNAITSRSLDVEAAPFADRAPEVYESVRGLATAMGIGEDASTFTIRTNSGIMSFFREGEACLGVLHQNKGFLPGIREKLTLVTKGLAGMALPS